MVYFYERLKMIIKIPIKPFSVNKCWQGKRYKTQDYKDYERDTLRLLPKMEIPEGDKRLDITAGVSNWSQDIDNIAKPLIDILQKKYGFNDKEIRILRLEKVKTKKGEEFVEFAVSPMDDKKLGMTKKEREEMLKKCLKNA